MMSQPDFDSDVDPDYKPSQGRGDTYNFTDSQIYFQVSFRFFC